MKQNYAATHLRPEVPLTLFFLPSCAMADGLLIVFHGCGSAWINIHDIHGHARRGIVSNYHEVGQIDIRFARRSLLAPEPQLVATNMGSVMARPRPNVQVEQMEGAVYYLYEGFPQPTPSR